MCAMIRGDSMYEISTEEDVEEVCMVKLGGVE